MAHPERLGNAAGCLPKWRIEFEAVPFDRHLVLVRDEHELIVLNETARLIWDEIVGGAAVADVARGIAGRFGVPPERAREDVETALADWRVRGLVGRRPSGGPAAPQRSGANLPPPLDFATDRTYALCGHPVRFRFQLTLHAAKA